MFDSDSDSDYDSCFLCQIVKRIDVKGVYYCDRCCQTLCSEHSVYHSQTFTCNFCGLVSCGDRKHHSINKREICEDCYVIICGTSLKIRYARNADGNNGLMFFSYS
jgi:hypothetical protein